MTPPNRLAHTVVDAAHLRAKRFAEAESHLRAALDLDSGFSPSYRSLAEVLFATGRTAEALRLLDRAIQLTPQSSLSYYSRAIVGRAAGIPTRRPIWPRRSRWAA